MRLICPNCDAQYEVPDEVLPAAGRDVQCSNCGQTWFQHHPDNTPDDDADPQDLPTPDEEVAPPPPPPPPPAPSAPERKKLDPAVADILRQEAEAEQAARLSSRTASLESQPDLGMDLEHQEPQEASERRANEARDRMARLRGQEQFDDQSPDMEPVAAAALGSRRDLLPDIEEINSTLRSTSARTGAGAADVGPEIEAPTHQRARRGFRVGFLTVLTIFIVLGVLYVIAPRLAESVPALKDLLNSYVFMVDQLRVWLDNGLKSALKSLDSVAQDSAN